MNKSTLALIVIVLFLTVAYFFKTARLFELLAMALSVLIIFAFFFLTANDQGDGKFEAFLLSNFS